MKDIAINVSFLRKLKKVWMKSNSPEKDQVIEHINESIRELQDEYRLDLELQEEFL